MKKNMLYTILLMVAFFTVSVVSASAANKTQDLIKMGLGIFTASHDRIHYANIPEKEVKQSKTGPMAWGNAILKNNPTFLIKGRSITFKKDQMTYVVTLNEKEDVATITIAALKMNLNTITITANQTRDKVTFEYSKGIDEDNEIIPTVYNQLKLSLSETSGQFIGKCGKAVGGWFSGGWNGSVSKSKEAWNGTEDEDSYYEDSQDSVMIIDTTGTTATDVPNIPTPPFKVQLPKDYYTVVVQGVEDKGEISTGIFYQSEPIVIPQGSRITLPDSTLLSIKNRFESIPKILVNFKIYQKGTNDSLYFTRETEAKLLLATKDNLTTECGFFKIQGQTKLVGGFEKIGFKLETPLIKKKVKKAKVASATSTNDVNDESTITITGKGLKIKNRK